ncbi:MAG: peptidoglycan-binding protein [Desulfobacteraceae bacterium]|nr:peptidoglycan-binding protein [Desulfobacteraceae bacterium]
MPTYKIKKDNECILTIAEKHKFKKWEKIYDHPKNEFLKTTHRKDPMCLKKGDEIYIPPKEQKKEACQIYKINKYVVPVLKSYFSIQLRDHRDQILAGVNYKLEIENKEFTGQSTQEGVVEEEISLKDEFGYLTIWPFKDFPEKEIRWRVKLGHLDPVNTTTGQQGRLNNLGSQVGFIDNEKGPVTDQAIKKFQQKNNLTVSGEANPDTQEKLTNPFE